MALKHFKDGSTQQSKNFISNLEPLIHNGEVDKNKQFFIVSAKDWICII